VKRQNNKIHRSTTQRNEGQTKEVYRKSTTALGRKEKAQTKKHREAGLVERCEDQKQNGHPGVNGEEPLGITGSNATRILEEGNKKDRANKKGRSRLHYLRKRLAHEKGGKAIMRMRAWIDQGKSMAAQ